MKRIHFTDTDLRNVRVGPTYGPLAETALSLERLVRTDWAGTPFGPAETIGFDGWREQLAHNVGPAERSLARLLPRVVDIITMTGRWSSIDEGLEAVASVPPRLVEAELAVSSLGLFRPPPWAAVLAEAPAGSRKQLAGALRAYHDKAIAPHWPAVSRLLEAERERAVHELGEQGIDWFLSTRHPTIRWDPPVLTIDTGLPGDEEAHLDGRGLVLVPSLFCPPGYPMCAAPDDPDASPVIHYPVTLDVATVQALWGTQSGSTTLSSLVALLGRTRAELLDAVATGPCTTSELARRAAVSVSSASEHAAVLRNADLIATRRVGKAVRHTVTPLGASLIHHHT